MDNPRSSDFSVKSGDTGKVFTATLRNRDGSVIDLTDAASAQLHVRPVAGGSLVVDEAMDFGTRVNGAVFFRDFTTTHLRVAGDYLYEIEVTWNDGDVTSFPDGELGFRFQITPDLG